MAIERRWSLFSLALGCALSLLTGSHTPTEHPQYLAAGIVLPAPEPILLCTSDGAPCDDSDACTVGDSCAAGRCEGAALPCDDGDACTVSRCDPKLGCLTRLRAIPSDGNPCTDDVCDPAIGPLHVGRGGACHDGDPCSLGDACSPGGVCVAGAAALSCDDGDLCTADRCTPGVGCEHDRGASRCDDGDRCTVDACDPARGCVHSKAGSAECRPRFEAIQPPRAAAIVGDPRSPTVTVTGRVASGARAIQRVTLNGRDVAVTGGRFVGDVPVTHGGNTLVIMAWDETGAARRRVQAFHWAPAYHAAGRRIPDGAAIRVAGDVLARDLSRAASAELANIDLADVTSGWVLHDGPTHRVTIEQITHDAPRAEVWPESGQIRVRISLGTIRAEVRATGHRMGCIDTRMGGWCTSYPTFDGDLGLDGAMVLASARLSEGVGPGSLEVEVDDVRVAFGEPRVELHGLARFASEPLTAVLRGISDRLEGWAETAIRSQLEATLGGLLGTGTFEARLDLEPVVASADVVPIDLSTRVRRLELSRERALVRLDATARGRGRQRVPWDVRGVVARMGCDGAEIRPLPAAVMEDRDEDITIAVADDVVNRVLYESWRSGLLAFEVDESTIDGARLERYGLTGLRVRVDGLLPPVVSDCAEPGEPRIHVGDLRVTADLKILGEPIRARLYMSLEGRLEVVKRDGELQLRLVGVEWVDGEVAVRPERLAGSDQLVAAILRGAVVPALADSLRGATLASLPVPSVEVGTSRLEVEASAVERVPGATLVRGEVRVP